MNDHKDGGDDVIDEKKLFGEPIDDERNVATNQDQVQNLCIHNQQCPLGGGISHYIMFKHYKYHVRGHL